MKHCILAIVHVVILCAGLLWTIAPSLAGGASADYGKTRCAYLKTKAQAANSTERRKALMAEYKRCLKEHGEG